MSQARKAKNHRSNRLLAALDPDDFAYLEPHLERVTLRRGTVIYETGDFSRHTYFPHDAIVSLVNVLEDGRTVKVANFGCEGMFSLLSALVTSSPSGATSCNAAHSVEERCCGWILNMQDRVNQDIVHLTHEFLAELLSVQRSTLSAVLGRLQAQGLISQRRGAIAVLDRHGLEQTACECHKKIRRVFSRLLPHPYSAN